MPNNDDLNLDISLKDEVTSEETPSDDDGFERQLKREQIQRDFREEGWFYWIRIGALLFIAVSGLLIVSSYILHLILPEKWHWLGSQQLQDAKGLAITIITGAIISQTTTYLLRKK